VITKLFLQQSKLVGNNLQLLQIMKSGYNYNIYIIEEDEAKIQPLSHVLLYLHDMYKQRKQQFIKYPTNDVPIERHTRS